MFGSRVAIVTGGSRGIGAAVSQMFLDHGARVVVADLDGDEDIAADDVARLQVLRADVSSPEDVDRLFGAVVEHMGRLDYLINNAGVVSTGDIFETSDATWDEALRVNLTGTFRCARAAAIQMRSQRFGRIVNIASMAGQTGGVMSGPAYAASKAGIVGLTKALARDCAPHGITVNAIAPGTIATGMFDAAASGAGIGTAQEVDRGTLVGRVGLPEEIAHAVEYLCADRGGYVTGSTLDVNGGNYLR